MEIKYSISKNQTLQETEIMYDFMREKNIIKNFPICSIGKKSSIDEFTVVCDIDEGSLECYSLQIGNYCTLESDIKFIINGNHDYKSVTTGALKVRKEYSKNSNIKRKGSIIIENDVKIGCGTIILSGVIVQNGAVVLPGSVVTKDVPAYAIAIGNPAEVINFRYASENIRQLLNIQWWYWNDDKINKYIGHISYGIEEKLKKFVIENEREKLEIKSSYIKTKHLTIFIPDFDSNYPIYAKVIKEYCTTTCLNVAHQFLILILENSAIEEHIGKVFKIIDEFYDGKRDLVVLAAFEEEIEGYISIADEIVMGRNVKTTYYSSLAHKYGVKVVFGTDIPVFNTI